MIDTHATIGTIDHHAAAMRVREALRMLLRAHEDMYGLPSSFMTKAEHKQAENGLRGKGTQW